MDGQMLVYPISVARAKYDHRPALLLIPSLRCIWPRHGKVGPRDQRASLARRVRPSCSSPHGFACCTRSVATHTFLRRTRRQNRRLTGAAPASPAIAVWKESRRWRQDGVHSLFAKVKKKKCRVGMLIARFSSSARVRTRRGGLKFDPRTSSGLRALRWASAGWRTRRALASGVTATRLLLSPRKYRRVSESLSNNCVIL